MTTGDGPGWDREAATARCDAATEGPWISDGHEIYAACEHGERRYDDNGKVVWIGETCALSPQDDANAAFIAAARTDLPNALAALAAVEQDNQRLREQIEAVKLEVANRAPGPEDGAPFAHYMSAYAQGFNAALDRISAALSVPVTGREGE